MNVTMKNSTTKNNEHNPFWIMPPTTCWLHYLKQKHYFVYLFWVLPPPFSLWLVPFRCVNGLLLVGMVRLDELALWGIELIIGFLIFLGEPRGFCRRWRCEYWIIVNLLLEGKLNIILICLHCFGFTKAVLLHITFLKMWFLKYIITYKHRYYVKLFHMILLDKEHQNNYYILLSYVWKYEKNFLFFWTLYINISKISSNITK